jgi:hypothetical protein
MPWFFHLSRGTIMSDETTVAFRCNVCNTSHEAIPLSHFGREGASCQACGSSVRMRGLVHHLSLGLFGTSLAIADFPVRHDLVGIGLSDWLGYAERLPEKLSYTNTFYHQAPFLDIAALPPPEWAGVHDFLISSDVFEHVPPPVERAFHGSFLLLKPGGLFVLTVPFTDVPTTVEHFPDLATFKVVEFDGDYLLLNRDAEGEFSIRDGLVFHGGPGDTLEMREFSRAGTIRMLEAAGFVDIVVHADPVPEWGILLQHHHGLPITARRPAAL